MAFSCLLRIACITSTPALAQRALQNNVKSPIGCGIRFTARIAGFACLHTTLPLVSEFALNRLRKSKKKRADYGFLSLRAYRVTEDSPVVRALNTRGVALHKSARMQFTSGRGLPSSFCPGTVQFALLEVVLLAQALCVCTSL